LPPKIYNVFLLTFFISCEMSATGSSVQRGQPVLNVHHLRCHPTPLFDPGTPEHCRSSHPSLPQGVFNLKSCSSLEMQDVITWVFKSLFTPLNGQFEAAFWLNPAAGPPLSVVKTMIESASMPCLSRLEMMRPTDSSSL
jgi:hypothetical protein